MMQSSPQMTTKVQSMRFYHYWQFWISGGCSLLFAIVCIVLLIIFFQIKKFVFQIGQNNIISNTSSLITSANATIAQANTLISNSEQTITTANNTLAQADSLMNNLQTSLDKINLIMGISNSSQKSPVSSNRNASFSSSSSSPSLRGLRSIAGTTILPQSI